MREICENEAEFCLSDIKRLVADQGGKHASVVLPNFFSVYILNTLWLMMAGIRYDSDNSDLKLLQGLLTDLFASIDMMGALFSHFPFLIKVAPEASGYNNFVSCHSKIHAFVRKEVDNHKKIFEPSNEPRDLIDAYLKVLYSGDENNNGKIDESFSELQLLAVCLDMFMAGTETTSKSTNFMFLHLVRNPKIQERAREEIDTVIGRSRLPTLEDRVK
jgi:cytochrome P450